MYVYCNNVCFPNILTLYLVFEIHHFFNVMYNACIEKKVCSFIKMILTILHNFIWTVYDNYNKDILCFPKYLVMFYDCT